MSKFKLNKQYSVYFWLIISILFALYYGIVSSYYGFSQDYIVQDDARQHVVWLQRFVEPELFPDDLIANYFISLAPLGYKFLYWLVAQVGIEPLVFAKILPLILGLITTIYIYLLVLEILPVPLSAFLSSLFLNQLMWLNDDLISATPRAFVYPLFAAFLYYLAKTALIPCLILMLLQGLFYPQLLLIEIALLTIRIFQRDRSTLIRLTRKKQRYIWWLLGLLIAAIALYPLTQKPPELSTVVTALQMKQMPEFQFNGRSPFFARDGLRFWLTGSSGIDLPWFPTIVWSGIILPWLLSTRLSIIKLITSKIAILGQVVAASLIMFLAAHILLPKLHLPSRYTYHSLRFILAISAGIVITICLDLGWRLLQAKIRKQGFLNLTNKLTVLLISLGAAVVIVFPLVPHVFINWFQGWRVGQATAIYQFLARQPQDILVASLSKEVNNIPAFSQRSIFVGSEFALAYHPDYHRQIQQRAIALLQAQYTDDLSELKNFISQYNIDFIMLDKNAFTPEYLRQQKWLINSSWRSETESAIAITKSETTPALAKMIFSCTEVATEELILLNTTCILKNQINNQ